MVNSLCHRDYSVQKGNEIAFYKDRIEIFNVGQFPEGKNPDDYIKKGEESILRNPMIANTLFLCKDIEKWGSGLRRISEACALAGIKVRFEKTSTGFKVIFLRPEQKSELGVKLGVKLGVNEQKIVTLIGKNNNLTNEELSAQLDISAVSVYKNIKKLKEKGILKRIGSDKGGYWEVTK